MFGILYNFAIHISLLLAKAVALFHTKTRQWTEGQSTLFQELRQKLKHKKDKLIWIHAASLGEFEQGRPVIEACKERYPNYQILLTFFSPSGYEMRKDYDQADFVCYLPADTLENVKQFLDIVQPDLALFIKYEFWHNYLIELHRRQIPTLLFSAIFRPNQLFFKSYGGFYKNMIFKFSHILVQNEESKKLLQSIGYEQVSVGGDTRLDRVAQIAQQVKAISQIAQFKGNLPLLIIGSAWADDMEVLIPFLNQWQQPLQVIIAPHEIDAAQIQQWQQSINKPSVLWSSIAENSLSVNRYPLSESSPLTPHPSLLTPDLTSPHPLPKQVLDTAPHGEGEILTPDPSLPTPDLTSPHPLPKQVRDTAPHGEGEILTPHPSLLTPDLTSPHPLPKQVRDTAPHGEGEILTSDSSLPTPNSSLLTPHSSLLTPHSSLLFLDTIGLLASTYQYADFVYIGGAFGDGLHNILEPAAFGNPIIFGQPYYKKFQEAHDLLKQGCAHSIANTAELMAIFSKLYHDTALRQQQATMAKQYIESNVGATQKVMQEIEKVLGRDKILD